MGKTRVIKFREEGHGYKVDGRRVISVTEALSSKFPPSKFYTANGRIIGTAVHKAIWLEIMGDLHYDSLSPLIKPRVDAWLTFRRECRYRPCDDLCEVPQYHPDYCYAGTPDIPGWINGLFSVPDAKCGKSPTARYQTAAYSVFPDISSMAANGRPDRYELLLKADRSYRLTKHDSPNDFLVFLECLRKAKETLT